MSNRLNQEREAKLQPKRIQHAINELTKLGIPNESDTTKITFTWKGEVVRYFPYSGWHTGKSIVDGRGWEKLKNQLI